MATQNLPALLTPGEVSKWLLLPLRTVERLGRAGELPAVELPNGDLLFEADALIVWLKTRRTAEGVKDAP
jgi:hypothetical protein